MSLNILPHGSGPAPTFVFTPNSESRDTSVLQVELTVIEGISTWVPRINIACRWKYKTYMSHFSYACKMRYPLNLVLENSEYLWFYWTFCIVILDYGLKLHKLLICTLIMLQKWLEIH